jgi:hypothetical protein
VSSNNYERIRNEKKYAPEKLYNDCTDEILIMMDLPSFSDTQFACLQRSTSTQASEYYICKAVEYSPTRKRLGIAKLVLASLDEVGNGIYFLIIAHECCSSLSLPAAVSSTCNVHVLVKA